MHLFENVGIMRTFAADLSSNFNELRKEKPMQKINTSGKFLFSAILIMGLALIMQLFTFSTSNEDDEHKKNFKANYHVYALEVPLSLRFADEKVPMHDIEVFERMDRELLINTYWQTQTVLTHKRANRWFPVIEPILKRNGIPSDFKYIPVIETGFMNLTSPAGAVGFWQFMEPTAVEYGLEVNEQVDERYHVEKSTQAACDYFNALYKEFGSWTLVAAAYNMGRTGLKNQMEKQNAKSYYDLVLNQETSRYVFRLVAMKEIMEKPKEYGYHLRKSDLYPQLSTYSIKVDTSVADFSKFAEHMKVNYKVLKTYNPWLRQASLINKEKKVYYISLPLGSKETF